MRKAAIQSYTKRKKAKIEIKKYKRISRKFPLFFKEKYIELEMLTVKMTV